MRFKINPEAVRLAQAVTAFIQLLGAGLTGTDVLPKNALVLIVVIGSALAGALTLYSQGMQTNPPDGMLTEERAAELSEERKPAAEPLAPQYVERWPSERIEREPVTTDPYAVGPYAAGRAPVRESPPTPDE